LFVVFLNLAQNYFSLLFSCSKSSPDKRARDCASGRKSFAIESPANQQSLGRNQEKFESTTGRYGGTLQHLRRHLCVGAHAAKHVMDVLK
jgi:hypothetical protein